jgi:hypothetical protein
MLLPFASCGMITYRGSNFTDAMDSVVFIEADFFQMGMRGSGTGFAIGEVGEPVQFIVTNAHLVMYTIDTFDGYIITSEKSEEVRVYFSHAANRFMRAEIYWWNTQKDLAILRLSEPTEEVSAAILRPSRDVNIHGDFYAWGFPGIASLVDDFSAFDVSDMASTRGGIQKQSRVDDTGVYLLDLEISRGNSGGPLVNSRGEVVGINTFMVRESLDGPVARYAVIIDELIFNIDRRRVPYTLAGELNPTGIVILGAAGVVALMLIITVIIVVSKKKKPAMAMAGGGYAPQGQQMQQQMPHLAAKAYIRALGGHFSGRNFEISGRVMMGRDGSKCMVAYPVDSAGISGIHCEVYVEGATAYVRDLGSSYGTFLANGTKLPEKSPQPLRNGDRFYLANAENTFELTIM